MTATNEVDWEKILAFLKPRPPLYSPHQPTIKQQVFLRSEAQEVLFGGRAGGGKSDALLMGALQYVDTPGYAAIIFRNTFADLALPGSLMDRSHEWLDEIKEVHWNPNTHRWTFPSGATLTFGYLDKPMDHLRYKSSEIQYCVERHTRIRMGDGCLKEIRDIQLGDLVATLEGPRRVTRIHYPGVKPCVKISTPDGSSTLVSATHRLLTPDGWASPLGLSSTGSQRASASDARSRRLSLALQGLSSASNSDLPPFGVNDLQVLDREEPPESAVWLGDGRIDFGESGDSRQVASLPLMWNAQLMLLGPLPRLVGLNTASSNPQHAPAHANVEYVFRDSERDCLPFFLSSCDERPHQTQGADPEHIPSPVDAAGLSRPYCVDDLANTREYDRQGPYRFPHPYTMASRDACVSEVVPTWVRMVPADVAEVMDLTVEGASHYITSSGIVSANCGFDEVTEIREKHYRYLFSRLRRPSGKMGARLASVPLRMRCASNPAPNWVRRRFIEEGKVNGRLYIPSGLEDNPFIDHVSYRKSLSQLDDVERARLERGDWYAEESGSMFKREWFENERQMSQDKLPKVTDKYGIDTHVGGRFEKVVRYWDTASTLPTESNPDPDWTVGALVGLAVGKLYILDIQRFRKDAAGVEKHIRAVADEDGPFIQIRMEQEPGASGKISIDHYARYILLGYDFDGLPAIRNKEARANLWSGKARRGEVILRTGGTWITDFLDEIGGFPESSPHDDQVDAISGANEILTGLGMKLRRPVEIIV